MDDPLAHSGHLCHHSLDFCLRQLLVHDDMDDPLAHSGHLRHHSLDFCLRQLLVHDDGYTNQCDSNAHNIFELTIKLLPIPFTQRKFTNKLEEMCM